MIRISQHGVTIKGIVFDMDGTLYSQLILRSLITLRFLLFAVSSPRRAYITARVILNYRRAQETMRRNSIVSENLGRDQLALAAQLSGVDLNMASNVVDFWINQLPLRMLRFCRRSGLIETFTWVRATGCHIGLFSDYPSLSKARVLGIESLVDVIVCSMDSEIGTFKPNPRGFKVAAERLGLSSHEIIYVGNRPDVDAEGALQVGMLPVIIRRCRCRSDRYISCASLREICKVIHDYIEKVK